MPAHRLLPFLGTLPAVLLLSGSATAGPPPDLTQLDLEALMELQVDTVQSASKHEQSIAHAPASVTVITREEIRDLGYRTLAEVLAGVRGLFVTYDRNYSYLGFRGFQRPGDFNTRILLLVDGHQWNDDLYDMAFIGPELGVDLDLVERIEVVRGPGSSMYGGNAFFGTVDVVTRRPGALGRGELSASAGAGRALGGRASAAFATTGGVEGLVSVSGSDVRGGDLRFPEYAASPGGGLARGKDWERWGSFLAKAAWQGLSLELVGMRRDKGVPTGAFETVFDDPASKTSDRRLSAELRYGWAATAAVDATLRAYFDAYDFGGFYPYAGAQPGDPGTLNVDDDSGRWVGAEAKAIARLGGGWLLVAGGELKVHLLQRLVNYDVGSAPVLSDRRSSAAGSVYAQLEAPLASWLRLVGGARLDRAGSFAEELSPRLAFLLTPAAGTTLKAMYGRAFRPPNDTELHYQSPGFSQVPVGLHPERMATYELALEQRLGPGLRLGLSAYHYDVDGLVDAVTDAATGLGVNVNQGAVRASAVEVEAEQRFARGVRLRASWALQRAEDAASGARLTNSPESLGKLQLHGPLGLAGLRGGAEVLYMSDRTTLAGATAPAHLVVNLSLTAPGLLHGALDLSLGLRNALGASYGDPGDTSVRQDLIAQDGRVLRAAATWRF